MFENVMLAGGAKGKRVWTTCVGATGQVLLVAGMAMVPMLWPEALPPAVFTMLMPTAPRGEGAKAKPETKPEVRVAPTTKPVRVATNVLIQPPIVPPTIQIVTDASTTTLGNVGGRDTGIVGGTGTGPDTGLLDDIIRGGRKPPVDPPVVIAAMKPPDAVPVPRIKVGGKVDAPRLIYRVEPVYPQLARTAHIEGVVKLRGVIAVDGHIAALALEGGHPLLAPAALEAVRQWRYAPTRLNDVPVELETTIEVTFRLNR
jgi:protein TonB